MKTDEKGVIYSQFTLNLDLLGKAMEYNGHPFVHIDGSVQAPKRIELIQQFNDDLGPRFILCSLLASGTGIKPTRGNHAFLDGLLVEPSYRRSSHGSQSSNYKYLGVRRALQAVHLLFLTVYYGFVGNRIKLARYMSKSLS
jgi:hypothetical protein